MDSPFPDGAWRGFYVYPTDDSRHYMDLRLTFREGTLSGVGDDDVGPFVIRGQYDVLTLEVHWTKTYIGRHSVFYKGYGEPARIWGTWELSGMTGGFKIWPGDGDGSLKRTAEAEVEEPDRAWLPVATPSGGGAPTPGSLHCSAAC